MLKTCWNLFMIVLLLALASCAPIRPEGSDFPTSPAPTALPTQPPALPTAQPAPTQIPAPSATPGVETQMSPTLPALTPVLQTLVDKARQDLASQLNVPQADLTLVEASEVTWPDSSLGCPQMGMMYSQVLTPGFLIRFEHASQSYEFHSTRGTVVIYCKNPMRPIQGNPANI